MENHVEKAVELHGKKYNCAQAVACAFCDRTKVDEETMFKLSEGFGGGMGGFQQVCGAVSGAIMVAGLLTSAGKPVIPPTKKETYRLAQEIAQRFQQKNGSVICKELKGIETGKVLRSCPGCVEDAARILEELFPSEGPVSPT